MPRELFIGRNYKKVETENDKTRFCNLLQGRDRHELAPRRRNHAGRHVLSEGLILVLSKLARRVSSGKEEKKTNVSETRQ
jgi:hypothetical protein